MQSEKAIKVDYGVARNGDAWTHLVVERLGVGNYDVESVGGAALEEHDQALGGAAVAGLLCGVSCAGEKAGDGRRSYDRQCSVLKKYTPCDRHLLLLYKLRAACVAPLGLLFFFVYPGLPPWARLFRPFGATVSRSRHHHVHSGQSVLPPLKFRRPQHQPGNHAEARPLL